MNAVPVAIELTYEPVGLRGVLRLVEPIKGGVWERITQYVLGVEDDYVLADASLDVPWPTLLAIVREFAPLQRQLGFVLHPTGVAKDKITVFVREVQAARKAQGTLTVTTSDAEISQRLHAFGFTKRTLTAFQLRDLGRLISLPNGANFSVPGAGKTTVTFALHLLLRQPGQQFIVVAPKNAFGAWQEVVRDCMDPSISGTTAEQFLVLSGGADSIERLLQSGASRFLITYDQLIRVPELISNHFSRHHIHLVLDESHRMKAGLMSQRGALLLNVAPLVSRRDVLSGTPMPQGPTDMQSQLDFLWPGSGLGLQISGGIPPRTVLGNLYVRTTKDELGLPEVTRHRRQVDMLPGQLALYGIVRQEALRQFSSLRTARQIDVIGARRSVMRLLQLSVNPVLALTSMSETGDLVNVDSGVVAKVLEEGPSAKMHEVVALAREMARQGQKSVIWTIFTDTLLQMERLLADLNPVTLYGAIPSGDPDDMGTREGRIRRFHDDSACQVMIANPAAAGEGISLHQVCHNAIYIDRSYVTTHFLQSIDRIHRLGLPPGTETNIYIFQTRAPAPLGSIDQSVARRLATKLRNLQQLLDDKDLHKIALDEENAVDPIDYGIDIEDILDLIEELEGRISPDEEGN